MLVTGFDIIFFWVARMMMLGLKFMGEVPFREVFIHGLVRDERGQKMSKSKGNVIDPLELIDKYGADALRFTILASTAQGRDIRFGEARVQGYRNFGTKLWNAARFCELNGCELDPAFDPAACRQTVNRWVVSKLAQAAARTREALEGYRFNDAANALYQFAWNEFCDWYLELAKPLLAGDDAAAQARDPGDRRLGAGPAPASAAPADPVRHRGALAAALRRARRAADRSPLARARRRADRRSRPRPSSTG